MGGNRVAGDGCAHLCGQYRTWGGGSEGGMDVCGTHGWCLFQERWEDGKSVLVDHIYVPMGGDLPRLTSTFLWNLLTVLSLQSICIPRLCSFTLQLYT